MKLRLLLATVIGGVLLSTSAIAQRAYYGVTVTPVGATDTSLITITVNPNLTCPRVGGLSTASVLRIHSGATVGGSAWQNVVPADADSASWRVTGFTRVGDNWVKSFRPRAYFTGVAAGEPITGINFVLNGGPIGGNQWSIEGKSCAADGTVPGGDAGNFFIALPVPATISNQVLDTQITVVGVKPMLKKTSLFGSVTPNPFSASTSLTYSLNSNEVVSVKVFNAIGAEVATLVSGVQTAGTHNVTWNAAKASKGVYLISIVAGNKVDSRRLVKID